MTAPRPGCDHGSRASAAVKLWWLPANKAVARPPTGRFRPLLATERADPSPRRARRHPAGRRDRPPAVLHRRDVERGILPEHPQLELAQRRRRLDSQLAGEHPAELAVAGERLRLASRAVERQDEPGAEPLAQRVLRDERFELGERRAAPERERLPQPRRGPGGGTGGKRGAAIPAEPLEAREVERLRLD